MTIQGQKQHTQKYILKSINMAAAELVFFVCVFFSVNNTSLFHRVAIAYTFQGKEMVHAVFSKKVT